MNNKLQQSTKETLETLPEQSDESYLATNMKEKEKDLPSKKTSNASNAMSASNK